VRLAQHMAVASERVRATAIEATEFPELSRAYQVMGVPKVVINDRVQFEGAVPEQDFLGAVLQAVAAA
jgi:alkyl hydroperoxide reductase subunit AhpF